MDAREFTDSKGVEWRVAEIIPQWAERRIRVRRAHGETPSHAPSRSIDLRRSQRRRVAEARPSVMAGYEQGWLTFESAGEKRRLAPVPKGWAAYTPAKLELLCRVARAVEKWRSRFIE